MKRLSVKAMTGASVLACSLGVAACGGASSQGQANTSSNSKPQSGGTLNVGVGADVSATIPWLSNQTNTTAILGQIYNTLFAAPSHGAKVVPELATGYKLGHDGRTYTIFLRRGVTFQTGRKLTAADVVWTLEKEKASSTNGASLASVKSVAASGASTVVISLKAPQPDLLLTMTDPSFGIVPKQFGGESQSAFAAHPVGTGPFAFKSRVLGTEFSLVQNAHYWKHGYPLLKAVNFKVYPNVNAESLAFKSGQIQLVVDAPLTALTSFGTGHLLNQTANSDMEVLQINRATPPMNSYGVRKTISQGINRPSLVKNLLQGHALAASALLSPVTFPEGVPNLTDSPYVYNPSAAKGALKDSTYKPGEKISLIFSSGIPGDADLAQAIQAELKQVGLTIQLEPLESTTWLKEVTTFPGTWNLSLSHAGGLTPSSQLGFIVDSKYFGGSWNTTDAAAALAAYSHAQTPQAQQKVLAAYAQHTASYLPAIPVVNRQLIFLAGPTLHGLTLGATENYDLTTAYTS